MSLEDEKAQWEEKAVKPVVDKFKERKTEYHFPFWYSSPASSHPLRL